MNEASERDPFNKLYARQSRWRLDAEFVRDNAVSIAGLLVSKIGGESVKPYQPPTHWEFLNFPTRTWVHDKNDSQYRRGLYTWWQRSFLQPSLVNFDAPSREECTAERPRSNTPLQSLTLLNDPTFVEAARVFAEKIIKNGGDGEDAKLKWAYEHALSREPQKDEIKMLGELYQKHLEKYKSDKEAAEKVLTVGDSPAGKEIDKAELAAWTSVSRTLLNLHETITRF